MNKIEEFVDSVYHNFEGNKKEIIELKAEMKSHLLEAVHELRGEGKSEEVAIEIAIERFGGEQEIRTVLGQLFRAQKTFAKWVLYLAITILVLSSTVFGSMWAIGEQKSHENAVIASQIFDILENKKVITEDISKEIENLVQSTNQIIKVQIYNIQDVKHDAENYTSIFEYVDNAVPNYELEKAAWAPGWIFDIYPFGNGNSEWYISMEIRHMDILMIVVFLIGVAVYAVLFTIWATINAYHQKRLTIGWILIFALLNVVGYWIYKFSREKAI